jgi:catechol 2,3-dioxygenase-like lactoylglutathione lyase family enzyme
MDMKLEVVVIPVADVDRAKNFYSALGWRLDADVATDESFRVVQMTPPGSPASVIFGTSVTVQAPGSATAFSSSTDLAAALRRAAAAHGEHEARTGAADANWPDWYAGYMVAEQAGTELPS